MTNDIDFPQQSFIKIHGYKNICYVLDDKTIEAISRLLIQHGVSFGIYVKTSSDQRSYGSLKDFLNWANKPHPKIRGVAFASLRNKENYSVMIQFATEEFELPVWWGLFGPENSVKAIESGINDVLQQVKRTYSYIYAGPVRETILSVLVMLSGILPAVYLFFRFTKYAGQGAFQAKHYRLPDGSVLEIVPLQPIDGTPELGLLNSILPYACILIVAILVIRAAKPFFPIGMFEIGFEAESVKRRVTFQNNFLWGGVICLIIGVLASLVANQFFPSI